MVGHLRQNVFSPLRGKGIAAAFTGSLGTFHSVLAENKVLHRGKKSLKVQLLCSLPSLKLSRHGAKQRITKTSLRPPGSSSVSMPGDPEAPRCLEMDLRMGIAKS